MKSSPFVLPLLGLVLVMNCAASVAQTAGDITDPGLLAGRVKTLRGDVRVHGSGAAPERALQLGDAVRGNDVLVTGNGASAGLTLQDGTLVALGARSKFRLDQFAYDPRTESGNIAISLLEGSMRFVSGAIAKLKGDSVRISTPTALVGVRGTDFIVEAGE